MDSKDIKKINRLEVIECGKGRQYVNMKVKNMKLSLQDDGKTLKIFVNYPRTDTDE